MEFVLIPRGTYMMWSPDTDSEAFNNQKPAQGSASASRFIWGHCSFAGAVESGDGRQSERVQGPSQSASGKCSLGRRARLLHKLNELEGGHYRLQTEAQWEYACRAGTESPRYHPDVNAIAWYKANSNDLPQSVGRKLPNAW